MIPLKEATGPLKKPIELREVNPTKAQSDDLARIYLQVVRLWRDAADTIMQGYAPSPDFIRDTVDEVEAAIVATEARANALIVSLSLELENWTRRFSSWHRKKFAQNVKTGTGVSVIEFMSNSAIQNEMKISLAWNIDLISNVSADMKRRIADIVWSGWRANEPRREIAKRINEAVGIERRRALRISVDQTTKLSADLDRARMLEMGITDWVWIHSRKAHPRLDHVARNGKEYNWITNRPPDVPGELPYCGCKARPLLKW